jgi:hypothetical protein
MAQAPADGRPVPSGDGVDALTRLAFETHVVFKSLVAFLANGVLLWLRTPFMDRQRESVRAWNDLACRGAKLVKGVIIADRERGRMHVAKAVIGNSDDDHVLTVVHSIDRARRVAAELVKYAPAALCEADIGIRQCDVRVELAAGECMIIATYIGLARYYGVEFDVSASVTPNLARRYPEDNPVRARDSDPPSTFSLVVLDAANLMGDAHDALIHLVSTGARLYISDAPSPRLVGNPSRYGPVL